MKFPRNTEDLLRKMKEVDEKEMLHLVRSNITKPQAQERKALELQIGRAAKGREGTRGTENSGSRSHDDTSEDFEEQPLTKRPLVSYVMNAV
mgnify:CR=1 FL=1